MEVNPLIPVGSKIKIDKSKIEKILHKNLLENLPKIIIAEVIDYKMTDGMEIGYVVTTEKKVQIWIFNNELNEETKKEYNIKEPNNFIYRKDNEKFLGKYTLEYEINGNRTVKTILNPKNIINWIIFTFKDIF